MEVYKRHSKLSFEFRSGVIREILLKENDNENSNGYHLLTACSGHSAIMCLIKPNFVIVYNILVKRIPILLMKELRYRDKVVFIMTHLVNEALDLLSKQKL